jgi:NADH-quinone oxidoreductase subunit N
VVAYLWAYLLASLPVFLFVNELERLHGSTDMRHLDGMGRREPGPALGLTLCLVSMAGLPPLVGFPVKLAVLANLWSAGETPALVVAVVMAVAGLGIYLTPIRVMYWEREADAIPARRFPPFLMGVMLAAGLLNVALGLQPKFLVRAAELSLNPTPVVQSNDK